MTDRATHGQPKPRVARYLLAMSAPGPVDQMTKQDTVLCLQAVRYRWSRTAQEVLQGVDITLQAGERVLLRGESGCGKSTLLSLAAGVLLPQSGQIALLGTSWATLSGRQRDARRADHIGYIFQQFNLLPYLDALANVMAPCWFSARRAKRLRAASPREEAQRLLEALQLPPGRWHQPASHLSVGEQQRVAAARALMGQPELVLADEPTSALDENRRDVFMQLLINECAAAGSALLFVSHDPRLANHFDRVMDLPQGGTA